MNHIEVIKRAEKLDLTSSKKTLGKKITGKFYTHEIIGRHLCKYLCNKLKPTKHISIIDPFCGDGRLVRWFMEECNGAKGIQHISIYLWDYEKSTVELAKANVEECLIDASVKFKIHTKYGNTFHNAVSDFGQFDLCITNPPWELLKPDHRDLQELTPNEQEEYIKKLRAEDFFLAKQYPLSQPTRRFSGWGTNLARVGVEVALKLTAPNGQCGIVSPASLVADQISVNLRKWMLESFDLRKISYFPAEARLFEGVDQASVALAFSISKPNRYSIITDTFNAKREISESSRVSIKKSQLNSWGHALPVQYGPSGIRLLTKFGGLAQLTDFECRDDKGLWTGREIDETGINAHLGENGRYKFLKGRMITRFGILNEPTRWVCETGPKVPSTANFSRIVWRDVSRPNQKRRMIATIVPSGWVAGNSLHVAYFRNGCEQKLKALLLILNSYCFEFQIRSFLATSHMSVGVVRQARVPDLRNEKLVIEFARIAEGCLGGKADMELIAEILCAQCYGLDRSEFKQILSYFPKLENGEIERHLEEGMWSRVQQIMEKIKTEI